MGPLVEKIGWGFEKKLLILTTIVYPTSFLIKYDCYRHVFESIWDD